MTKNMIFHHSAFLPLMVQVLFCHFQTAVNKTMKTMKTLYQNSVFCLLITLSFELFIIWYFCLLTFCALVILSFCQWKFSNKTPPPLKYGFFRCQIKWGKQKNYKKCLKLYFNLIFFLVLFFCNRPDRSKLFYTPSPWQVLIC